MGTWFRDYVYIPLGGNKGGLAKQLRNIAIVWLLTGFWHGASWNFVLWGVYFGILLVLEKLFLLRWLKKLPNPLRHIYALVLVTMSYELDILCVHRDQQRSRVVQGHVLRRAV